MLNSMSPVALRWKPVAVMMMSASQRLAGFQQNAAPGKAVDLVGDDRGLAGLDGLEQVAVRNEGDALPPRPVTRREVGRDVVVGSEIGLHRGQQILLGGLGLFEGLAGKRILIEQDLAARDLVDPGLVDLQLAQRFGDLDRIASGPEIGRRALQHGDMGAIPGHRRDQCRRSRAGADDDDALVLVVEIVRPILRMNDRALESRHVLPFGRIAFGMAIIALAHPEEVGGEAMGLAGVRPDGFDGPEVLLARPARRADPVLIADMAAEIVFLDHLAHIFENLRRRRDRRAGPRLEAVAEGMKVAVGADAGITVRPPGPAKALLGFEHDKTRPRTLPGQMVGGAHPRDTGAGDDDVKMLGQA